MEPQALIPLHIIQTSLSHSRKVDLHIVDGRVIIQHETIGLKIGFASNQSQFTVKYKNSVLEFKNVSEVVLGAVDADGWMSSFADESEIEVIGATPIMAAANFYPDIFFRV